MMNTLEVVRAGAGSGKTTDLCQTVADAVAGGLDPARILATTFTRKAAAELKGRIQAKLLSGSGNRGAAHDQADRLELAAIGTVHSVAHQLLARYAIDLGLSPRLEVITEHGSDQALRDLLGAIPLETWQPLANLAERLGISELHQQILKLLSSKRGNRLHDDAFTEHMAAGAERVCELLAPDDLLNEIPPANRLYELAEEALRNIDQKADSQKNTEEARQKLRRVGSGAFPFWGSYLEAARIKAGKTSGADACLDPLRHHATQVRQNPQLHADVREFSRLLVEETIRLDAQYLTYKAGRGLVDYTDLEILLLELLENEELCSRVAGDFDLVLVDEFQDTNPLQLAIFQCLRSLVHRNRWVGDPKQAIYGFRDTDPQLVNEIWDRSPEAGRTELPNNHRSQKGLVQLVGALFTPVFGDEAQQGPKRPAASRGVERWIFDSKNQNDDALALACGIAQLHTEGVRFGDIAVLERTNRHLISLADALDSLGIPYLMESPGLFSTREGGMLLAGLRLVADRSDSLAAATVLHLLNDPLQDTPEWIAERLEALHTNAEGNGDAAGSASTRTYRVPWESDPRLSRLERIDHTLLSPSLVTQEVIEALELPLLIQKWGDPARRCSNIDSALQHAREYEDLAFGSGAAATLSGLILYLEQLAADEGDMRYTSQGHDAVTLMTYHGAKGLEWPIVVLSGLNSDRDPDMWSPVVTGGSATDDPLAGRTLRSWTWPFGESDGDFPKLRTGSGLEADALNAPEGVERSAREDNENLRLLYVGCTRARQKLVFAHRSGKYALLNLLPLVDTLLNPDLDAGEHKLDGVETSYVVRHLAADLAEELKVPAAEQSAWISQRSVSPALAISPRFHSPSQVDATADGTLFDITELPGSPYFPPKAEEAEYAAIGNAVHSYMAALPSIRMLADAGKLLVAERCLSAYSVSGLVPPPVLVSAGERFRKWVESTYPGALWHVEVPVSGPRSQGGQWAGTADLVLQLSGGEIVIIDHKSAPIRREHCAKKAAEFVGQLSAYSEVFEEAGTSIDSMWIHFPLAGVVGQARAT